MNRRHLKLVSRQGATDAVARLPRGTQEKFDSVKSIVYCLSSYGCIACDSSASSDRPELRQAALPGSGSGLEKKAWSSLLTSLRRPALQHHHSATHDDTRQNRTVRDERGKWSDQE